MRIVDDSARQSNALLLTARKLIREAVCLVLQPDDAQHRHDAVFDLDGIRAADNAQGEGNILKHCLLLEQAEVLEDHAEPAAVLRNARCGHLGKVCPADPQLAARDALLAKQQLGHGRLAGAAVSHDEDKFAVIYFQIQIIKRDLPAGITLGYILEFNHSLSSDAEKIRQILPRRRTPGTGR